MGNKDFFFQEKTIVPQITTLLETYFVVSVSKLDQKIDGERLPACLINQQKKKKCVLSMVKIKFLAKDLSDCYLLYCLSNCYTLLLTKCEQVDTRQSKLQSNLDNKIWYLLSLSTLCTSMA